MRVMNNMKITKYFDRAILFFMAILILILPVAHTTSLRAACIILPVMLWLTRVVVNKERWCGRTPLDIPIIIFAATVLLSLFTSLKISVSLNELRGELGTQVLLFYLIVNNIKREEQVKLIIFALGLGSLIMGVYGIADFFIDGGSMVSYAVRAGSLHQGFGAYAHYIIMVLPFLVVGIFYTSDHKYRFLLIILILLNIFALYITFTRGAWVAFFVEIFMVLFIFSKKKWIPVLLLFPVFLLPFFLPKSIVFHEEKIITGSTYTSDRRLAMWRVAVKGMADNPFKGAGYGKVNFQRRFLNDENKHFLMDQAHNSFVNIAVQLGIQGLFALLFIIYRVLKMNWTGYKRITAGFSGYFFVSTFIMTIGYFVGNLFVEFYIDDSALMFWLLVGLSTALFIRERPKAESL